MFKITLPADRAEPDMAAVASAFGISNTDLEDDIHIGTISRWFEVGEGNDDNKPHQIFASTTLGIRVDVDERGNVFSVTDYVALSAISDRHGTENGGTGRSKDSWKTSNSKGQDSRDTVHLARLDALLDEALDESFPASDPIAISFDSPPPTARSIKKSDDG